MTTTTTPTTKGTTTTDGRESYSVSSNGAVMPVRYARNSGPRKPGNGEDAYTVRERALQKAAREEDTGEAATSTSNRGFLAAAPTTKAGRETHLGRRIRFLSFLQGIGGPTYLSMRMYGKKSNMGTICSVMTGRQDRLSIPFMKRLSKALDVPFGVLLSGNIGAVRTDHFGMRLRAYREMERLSLREVAARGEMSFNTVTKWEQVEYPPYDDRLLAFSVALDVPLDELQAYAKLAPPAPHRLFPPRVTNELRKGPNNLAEYNERVRAAGLRRFPPPTREMLEEAERKIADFNARNHEDTWRRKYEEETRGEAATSTPPTSTAMKTARTGVTEELGRTRIDDRQAVSAMQALFQHAVDEGKTITITINPAK